MSQQFAQQVNIKAAMNGDDDIDVGEIGSPSQEQEMAWQIEAGTLLTDWRSAPVALYPSGIQQFESFLDCLRFLRDCKVVFYCEPSRSKAEHRESFDNLEHHIAEHGAKVIGPITIISAEQEMDCFFRDVCQFPLFFPEPHPHWCLEEEMPDLQEKLWLHRADVKYDLACPSGEILHRSVAVVHLGCSGHGAWAYLLVPHRIRPTIILAEAPWG